MKATCPNNPKHSTFATTAHVMQVWIVDQHGGFLEEVDNKAVTHPPNAANLWNCTVCGAEAKVEE